MLRFSKNIPFDKFFFLSYSLPYLVRGLKMLEEEYKKIVELKNQVKESWRHL